MSVLYAADTLRRAVAAEPGRAPCGSVAYILNPLDYAWALHQSYVKRFAPAGHRVEALLVGMNPGPWGMAQTGVPFGSPDVVRDFLGLRGKVVEPAHTHPKRPVLGLKSPRSEVSGTRLWGAVQQCFGSPEHFFERFFVVNYFPLVYQSATGVNITPDKAPADLVAEPLAASDAHLVAVIRALKPQAVIGVGKWAQRCVRRLVVAHSLPARVGGILHPSPASPAANRGWFEAASKQLDALGHGWR